jgi:hypothetical protein
MPQGRKSSSRKRKKAPAEPSLNGVLLRVDGDQVTVEALGQTKPTELPTLLRLAAQLSEKQLGIQGG